ncbi:hypothetical protein ACFXKG_20810 [Streptomyces sp. NPDC059255]|uniref:nSTAND1 domain-containing NTPase n=1 Tax=Streptomyces sp. NPDC059255 TaxID=3346793 RepID=UPI003695A4E4
MVTVAESGQPPVSYLIPTDGLLAARPELHAVALPPSPFRGLTAFQESDAALFHGRQEESDKAARAPAAERRVTVVAPSGSGKSSLAPAGVAPRRRARGARVVVMRPASGSSPLAVLASALLPLLEPGLCEIVTTPSTLSPVSPTSPVSPNASPTADEAPTQLIGATGRRASR